MHACPPVIVPPDKFRPTYSNFTLGSDPTWFILRLRSGAALGRRALARGSGAGLVRHSRLYLLSWAFWSPF